MLLPITCGRWREGGESTGNRVCCTNQAKWDNFLKLVGGHRHRWGTLLIPETCPCCKQSYFATSGHVYPRLRRIEFKWDPIPGGNFVRLIQAVAFPAFTEVVVKGLVTDLAFTSLTITTVSMELSHGNWNIHSLFRGLVQCSALQNLSLTFPKGYSWDLHNHSTTSASFYVLPRLSRFELNFGSQIFQEYRSLFFTHVEMPGLQELQVTYLNLDATEECALQFLHNLKACVDRSPRIRRFSMFFRGNSAGVESHISLITEIVLSMHNLTYLGLAGPRFSISPFVTAPSSPLRQADFACSGTCLLSGFHNSDVLQQRLWAQGLQLRVYCCHEPAIDAFENDAVTDVWHRRQLPPVIKVPRKCPEHQQQALAVVGMRTLHQAWASRIT